MDFFFTLVITGLLGLIGYVVYMQYVKKQKTSRQAVVLVNQIKKVCKFVTVEGDFAEIYHYEDVKERFLKLISSRKKALIVINAKAQVGFDLSKIEITTDEISKKVLLKYFPKPEILSIETNLQYYDKKDGYFNKFAAQDLTELQKEAKLHIEKKIPESGLFEIAEQEVLEVIQLADNLVKTIGWTLDYKVLELPE